VATRAHGEREPDEHGLDAKGKRALVENAGAITREGGIPNGGRASPPDHGKLRGERHPNSPPTGTGTHNRPCVKASVYSEIIHRPTR
jgi:hypothetical protein